MLVQWLNGGIVVRESQSKITLARASLAVGIVCVVLAFWALMQGEAHDGVFGLALGAFLLACWRWGLARSK